MNNLHISLTEFRNESRVLRETSSIANMPQVDKVYIAALWSDGLARQEAIGESIQLDRFELSSRGLSRGLVAQLFKYGEFVWRVARFYGRRDIGMINVHVLGLLPLGYFLKRLYGARLVYDAHELETETHGSGGLRQKLGRLIERLFIGRVDHVIVVAESIADWYAATYPIPRPTVVLNAPRLIASPEKTDRLREDLGIRPDQTIFLYQGLVGQGRGIELLMDAFDRRTGDDAVLVVMGYGHLEQAVVQRAARSANIFFRKAVPPAQLPEYTASADIGLSLIENTCLSYYFCLPNKLFEYAMAGLPIVVSDMKEMREIVSRYGMGEICDAQTPEAVNSAIDRILERDLVSLGRNARQCAIENAWETQEKRMIAAYAKMFESDNQ